MNLIQAIDPCPKFSEKLLLVQKWNNSVKRLIITLNLKENFWTIP